MKTKITLLAMAFLISLSSFAQQGINYKAIIKDNLGNVVTNQNITVQFTILEDASVVYTETHTPITDANGLIVLNIGTGTTSDIFTDINWGNNDHFLKTEIDVSGGTTYIDLDTTQFQSVPYAKFAENSVTEINNLTDAKTVDSSIYLGNGSGDADDGNDNQNTAIGSDALKNNTSGVQNVAVGESTMLSNTSGNRNTAVGEEALSNNISGIGNVAIGNLAGSNETGSNKLYIENSNADADNALIYGEFDNNIVRINGELQIGNPSTSGYALPAVDGAAGEVLTTVGDGTTSWSTPVNDLPTVININISSPFVIGPTNGVGQIIPFDTENIDTNSEFDTTTSRFTATTDGHYRVYTTFILSGDNASFNYGIHINGNTTPISSYPGFVLGQQTYVMEEILSLNALDVVDIRIKTNLSLQLIVFPSNLRASKLHIHKLD